MQAYAGPRPNGLARSSPFKKNRESEREREAKFVRLLVGLTRPD